MKLSDEELSRVLTAHEQGGLERGGDAGVNAYPACLVQAAKVCRLVYCVEALAPLRADADWFDDNYQPNWTVEEFLAKLKARGLA